MKFNVDARCKHTGHENMLINKLRFHREGGCTLQDGDEEWEGEGHCCNQTGSKWWSQRPRSKMDLSSWLVTDLIIWAVEFSELNNGNLVAAIAWLAQRWTAYSFPQQFLYVGSQWLHSRATWIPMCVCQFFQTRTVRKGCRVMGGELLKTIHHEVVKS